MIHQKSCIPLTAAAPSNSTVGNFKIGDLPKTWSGASPGTDADEMTVSEVVT